MRSSAQTKDNQIFENLSRFVEDHDPGIQTDSKSLEAKVNNSKRKLKGLTCQNQQNQQKIHGGEPGGAKKEENLRTQTGCRKHKASLNTVLD